MPIYAIEVAIVCDDVKEDGIAALGAITDALGIDPTDDNVMLEVGADESGHPVLVATLSASDPRQEDILDDSRDSSTRS
jgi:hypothetical protein